MLTTAIRYQPFVRELDRRPPARVLEVGSGPEGLSLFWRGSVIGADLGFKRRPLHRALAASALALPFASHGLPVVISCDSLEHIPPGRRRAAVLEMARVAQGMLLLSFPSGDAAMQVYRDLARRLGHTRSPQWLREHLELGLPDATNVEAWLVEAGWSVTTAWYESAAVHRRLLGWELRLPVKILTYGLVFLFGPWVSRWIPMPSAGAKLRVFIRAERR